MINPPDIRLKASGPQIAQARRGRFVLHLTVQGPGARQAIAQARQVINQLREIAEEADFAGAGLEVPDLDKEGGRSASELTIEQKSQREVRLQLTLVLTLHLGESSTFWGHAGALALATDFLQGFSQRPQDKGIEIYIQRACALEEGTGRSDERGEGAV